MTPPTPSPTREARFLAAEDGAAILEFALVLPLVFALLGGCFELGRALMVRQAMLEGIRSGARTLARLPDPSCRPACSPRAENVLQATRGRIAEAARVASETVRVTTDWDGATRFVTMRAEVALHGDLLGAFGLASLLTLSTTHHEAWVAE